MTKRQIAASTEDPADTFSAGSLTRATFVIVVYVNLTGVVTKWIIAACATVPLRSEELVVLPQS